MIRERNGGRTSAIRIAAEFYDVNEERLSEYVAERSGAGHKGLKYKWYVLNNIAWIEPNDVVGYSGTPWVVKATSAANAKKSSCLADYVSSGYETKSEADEAAKKMADEAEPHAHRGYNINERERCIACAHYTALKKKTEIDGHHGLCDCSSTRGKHAGKYSEWVEADMTCKNFVDSGDWKPSPSPERIRVEEPSMPPKIEQDETVQAVATWANSTPKTEEEAAAHAKAMRDKILGQRGQGACR
jgi:hypothetical protein